MDINQKILLEMGKCIECKDELTEPEKEMGDGLCDLCRQFERERENERKHPDDPTAQMMLAGGRLA